MIKVSDFIANFLVQNGIKHVFMVTGGGAMHLNDSFGKHEHLEIVFNHHEQACAMAAESYSRLTNNLAVVNVTSGPGGLNALNGVFGAWTDSIPMLVLSGQVRLDTTRRATGLPLRQMGDQEYDIIESVLPMTKYAAMIADVSQIKYELEKAIYIAKNGRPGPVWLDIPLNIQGALIDEKSLLHYDFPEVDKQEAPPVTSELINDLIEKIQNAKRPVLMLGTGVRLSNTVKALDTLISLLKIPVVTAFNAHDLVTEDCPYYVGRPGTVGDRSGNFAVQNADLLIVFGCRLNIRQIGYFWESFAREAYKVMVDIDEIELKKPTLKIDLPIHADLKEFIPEMLFALQDKTLSDKSDWLTWCKTRKEKYPVVQKEYWNREENINPYCFMSVLSDLLDEDQIIVTANATACITAFQTMKIKKGQRLYSNSGSASMGYELPAAIGACFGSNRKMIICLAGDGSIQMNIQELATIRYYQLPIKIFVLNNNGYHSIRQTQSNFFGTNLVGVDPNSGLFFPSIEKIAHAYEMQYVQAETHDDLNNSIAFVLSTHKPALCEIMVTSEQPFAPKMSSKRLADGRIVSKPLEDLAPFLERSELKENMIIDLLAEEV